MEKFRIYKRKSCLKRHICSTRQIPKVRAKCIHLLYAVQIRLFKDGALGSFAITTFYYPKRSPQSSLLIFYCVLWVIFKTASVLKKKQNQNNTQPIHGGNDHTSTPELRAGGVQHSKVHGKPLCLSSGYAVVWATWVCWVLGMSVSARTKTLTQTSDYSEYLNIKAKVGTTSCDTCDLPQPCVKTSCTEAFNVTA